MKKGFVENGFNFSNVVKLLFAFVLTMTIMSFAHAQERKIPAFPGAEGGGRYTIGGRGGAVLKVTNLNDSGPGSLRQALETSGPRTVVFEVAGTIELQSRIRIRHGSLTIAGQTAPGQGITIKGHPVQLAANNVIIRFIRFRPGDLAGSEVNALMGYNRRDIIIDHCSFSWGTDEVASFYDNEYFTLQWSIISESLNYSEPTKGANGNGGIWGGRNASFLNNILAHNRSSNPRFNGTRVNPPRGVETTELINNLIYNWGSKAIYGGEGGRYILANNIFIPGPATNSANHMKILEAYTPTGQFYLSGNVIVDARNRFIRTGWQHVTLPESATNARLNQPFLPNNLDNAQNPQRHYNKLLQRAGASLMRDDVDKRIIREIEGRTFTYGNNGLIESQTQVGGWPVLTGGKIPNDNDNDGICDQWEAQNGLNPANPDDRNLFTLHTDYTNLEVYINQIVERKLAGVTTP